MFRIYLTEAIKNIKSKISLSLAIVFILIMVILLIGYSSAWICLHIYKVGTDSGLLQNEAYIEYSVYSFKAKEKMPIDDLIRTEIYEYSPDDPQNPILRPLSEEDIAHNEMVVSSYEKLYYSLKNIDGLILFDKLWSNYFSDNGNAYHLSLQNSNPESFINYANDPYMMEFYLELGYSENDIAQFCHYNCVRYSIDTILKESFTYSEGRGWTEEDLDFEYRISDDGTLPTIPVVMGYNFKDYYDVGDIIQNPESGHTSKMFREGYSNSGYYDQFNGKLLVIGFLSDNTIVERSGGIKQSLDSYILIPTVPNTPEYFPDTSNAGKASSFYETLMSKQIYIEKENESEIVAKLNEVLSNDTVKGIYIYPEKLEQANAVFAQIAEKRIISFAVISGATLVFVFAVLILITVNDFKKNIKDIAIHRLIGAKNSDIINIYVLKYAIFLLCADILSHGIYIVQMLFPKINIKAAFIADITIGGVNIYLIYPLMLAMNVLILAVVALVAYICSSRLDTATIIKGKE